MRRPVVLVFVAALVFLGGAVGYALRGNRAPGAGSADVGFLQDMILHHEQAVRMATTADSLATESVVRHFAREVILFQQYEIGLMEAYLERWGRPRASGRDTVMAWMGHPVRAAEMPGLASDDELDVYERATGRDVDTMFLRLMIRHHEGGVHMAEAAATRVRDERVAALAGRMAANQRTEINEYKRAAERLAIPL